MKISAIISLPEFIAVVSDGYTISASRWRRDMSNRLTRTVTACFMCPMETQAMPSLLSSVALRWIALACEHRFGRI